MKKKPLKKGNKHRILLYRRMMDRVWSRTIWLFGLLAALLVWPDFLLTLTADQVLMVQAGAVVSGGITVFALLTRNAAYVQPRQDHLRIATPFMRLAISYRRFRGVRSVEFIGLYPMDRLGWANSQFLLPFASETAVVVLLDGYPLPRWLLKVFLSRFMFYPLDTGLVFLSEDWMKLSTEIDSRYGSWRQHVRPSIRRMGFQRGAY